jgi:hypothetical protein
MPEMPELPDVEGFKRVLAKNALRKTIARAVVSDARILGKLSARIFASRLKTPGSWPLVATASISWRKSTQSQP